jgi:hypothetical protein
VNGNDDLVGNKNQLFITCTHTCKKSFIIIIKEEDKANNSCNKIRLNLNNNIFTLFVQFNIFHLLLLDNHPNIYELVLNTLFLLLLVS